MGLEMIVALMVNAVVVTWALSNIRRDIEKQIVSNKELLVDISHQLEEKIEKHFDVCKEKVFALGFQVEDVKKDISLLRECITEERDREISLRNTLIQLINYLPSVCPDFDFQLRDSEGSLLDSRLFPKNKGR